MKRVLALALAMVMALSLAACGGSGDTSTGDSGSSGGNVVRIGVFEPATGDSGPGGKQEMLGMQYANKETPHGGHRWHHLQRGAGLRGQRFHYRQGAHRRGGAGEQGCQPGAGFLRFQRGYGRRSGV